MGGSSFSVHDFGKCELFGFVANKLFFRAIGNFTFSFLLKLTVGFLKVRVKAINSD